jgi:hypothetical protein
MKRFLRIVFGLVLLLLGAGLVGVGVTGIAVFGQEGQAQAESEDFASDPASAAIVADVTKVDVALPFARFIGTPTLTVTSAGATSVFAGTGEQEAVDTYLYGVPYDLATRNGGWSSTPVPGVQPTAPDPQSQDFWIERDLGAEAVIELSQPSAPQTLVIMNADGSAGVNVAISLGFQGENTFWFSVAAIAVGAGLVLLAGVLLFRGRRSRRDAGQPAAMPQADDPQTTGLGILGGPDDQVAADQRSN